MSSCYDGFNLALIKKFWEIMKDDIMEAVLFFQNNGFFPRSSNASFMTLPKVANPTYLCEYRSISLVGSMYKIISKLLSIRLKTVLSKIIYQSQDAFLEGRGMLDSVLVAN